MSGPKPLSARDFALRHAERLNYTLVKILAERSFVVRCNGCALKRTVEYKQGHLNPTCPCTHKRKFFIVKRTPETHTQELHARGYVEYTCLKTGKLAKDLFTYRHACGYKFRMTKDCFVGCTEPCSRCRQFGYTNDDYLAIMQKYSNYVIPAEQYLQHRQRPKGMLHQFIGCGHRVRLNPERFTQSKDVPACRVCSPNRVWYRFKVGDVSFRTRSQIERSFVRFLVCQGIDPKRIEYEPKDCKVSYYNEAKAGESLYTPDFRVGNTHFEIKDLSSLGLRYYHWKDKDEALIENRAKYQAAVNQFDDYRVYVYIKGSFYRTHRFWTIKEKQRLLSLGGPTTQ